jgi:hypothetical protein
MTAVNLKIKGMPKVPFLYLIIYKKLVAISEADSRISPVVSFSTFRTMLTCYFHIKKEDWFLVAKELQDLGLLKIVPNSFIKLKLERGKKYGI